MIGSMPGESTAVPRSICKKSSEDGVTNHRHLKREMQLAIEGFKCQKPGYLRTACNSLKQLGLGKKVSSGEEGIAGSRSPRFLPSKGKRLNVAKKIDIHSRKRIRLIGPGAVSQGKQNLKNRSEKTDERLSRREQGAKNPGQHQLSGKRVPGEVSKDEGKVRGGEIEAEGLPLQRRRP